MEQRIRLHKTCAPMVQRQNRCIRLNYANEFHMDLLPACSRIVTARGALSGKFALDSIEEMSSLRGMGSEYARDAISSIKIFFKEEVSPFSPYQKGRF